MQTTSNAASARSADAARANGDRSEPTQATTLHHTGAEAAAQFEGLLFASALAPLSNAIGPLGDVLTNAVATDVARGTHDEFYAQLEALANRTDADHDADDRKQEAR